MDTSDFSDKQVDPTINVQQDTIGKIAACIGLSVTSFAAMHGIINLTFSPYLTGTGSFIAPFDIFLKYTWLIGIYLTGFTSSFLLYMTWHLIVGSRVGLIMTNYANQIERLSCRHLLLIPFILLPMIVDRSELMSLVYIGSGYQTVLFYLSVVIMSIFTFKYGERILSFLWLFRFRDEIVFALLFIFTAVSAVEAVARKSSELADRDNGKQLEFCRNYSVDDLNFSSPVDAVMYKTICEDILNNTYKSIFK